MPISWGVDHAARLVLATGRGELSRTDLEQYLDRLAAAATLSFSKVFHMDDCHLALTDDDLAAIGAKVRSYEGVGSMGRVAVIAATDELYDQARLFDAMVVAERPLRIFRDAGAAYDWLASEPVQQPGVDTPLFPDPRLPLE
ncbi:MAG: hypothetical protein ISP49_07305 [Reyranella sp.]|jgi:hypothetical protein|nr:hypothetical protein [Reyranella sp.]MBL6651383.1 hypothetical protein [Reyranella sp.]